MCSAGSWSARLLWTRPSVPTRFPVAVHIAPSGRCFLAQWTECSPGGGYGHAEVALPQARIEQAHRSLGLGFGKRTRKMLRLRTESRIQPGLLDSLDSPGLWTSAWAARTPRWRLPGIRSCAARGFRFNGGRWIFGVRENAGDPTDYCQWRNSPLSNPPTGTPQKRRTPNCQS